MQPVVATDSPHQLSVERKLPHYGELGVFIGRDDLRRAYMGVRMGGRAIGPHLLIEIDRVIQLELERGLVDSTIVLTERGIRLLSRRRPWKVARLSPDYRAWTQTPSARRQATIPRSPPSA